MRARMLQRQRWLTLAAALVLAAFCPAKALVPGKAFHHYVRNAWSIQEGLPQVSANAIAQDGEGYLWVGTQTGLARFDGVRFVTFTPDNAPALPGTWIRALLTDPSGAVWVGTYEGLARHDRHGFQAIPASDPQRFPALDIVALALADDGSVIAATSEGTFQVVGAQLRPLPGASSPSRALLVRGAEIWIGGSGRVIRLRDGHATELPLPAEAADAAVDSLGEAQGRIWLGSSRGLFVWAQSHWQRVPVPAAMAHAAITVMVGDRDGNWWVGSDAGLARLRDGRVVEWVGADRPGYVKAPIAGFEDREGNLWLGSQSQGLLRLWNGWTRRYSESDGLHEPLVWSLAHSPDGRVWVGTHDGVSAFVDGRFEHVVPGSALPNPQAYNLLAETDRLWIGTRRGVVLWHRGRIETPAWLQPLVDAQINGIVRDPDTQALWFAASNGLFRERTGVLQRLQPEQGSPPAIRYLLRTRAGEWLAGGLGGLFAVRGERLVALGRDHGLPLRLDVTSIHELADGGLIVGALGERIYLFDGERWHALGPERGMPANAPFFISEDDRGMLWLAGIRGISRVPLADLRRLARGEIERVAGEMIVNERGDLRSGQQGLCCNGAGNSKGFVANGALWLPSRDGIVVLDPHEVAKNPVPPSVVIESIQAQGRWRDIDDTGIAALPQAARDLQFAFAALSFQDPRSTLIQYRLSGYDADWHTLGDGEPRRANYTNLPPRRYRFEVRAANNAGVWGTTPAQLEFRIPARFTETGGFRALMVLAALAALVVLLRWVQARHDRQQAHLQRLVDERTAELHALNQRLRDASQTDPLTGLRNRRFLELQMPADIGLYDRENPGVADHENILLFALIDIDAFKAVNDRYGHAAGDRVLQQFAQLLTRLQRTGDYIVRWGGEEFLVVFRPMPHRLLSTIGERLRSEIANHVFVLPDARTLRLTASIGMSEYPLFRDGEHRLGWQEMVELADRALYWVKHHGRNGWAALRPTASTRIATLLAQMREDLDMLLQSGQLRLLSAGADAQGELP